ncbi:B12-binding domain-containing radical SAM protein [Sediminitomix flava]|uniref:Radical SAM superfamily enzyme YgiQ (UPF0313 family) n=1 Tax=Sediminitomix flava TaxID=379075 RepID=A0A315ZCP9_SEDFL|nr:radical SAM protein [Sediminitomix flava]PWJ42889.1 radical SAM superfamily enzyme YgiQ (UPF0313 family) [Sediminitomix flava]
MTTQPKFLLLTPPLTQLNTPYPATAYIKGFLDQYDIPSEQGDLGIDLILRIFNREGLIQVFEEARQAEYLSEASLRVLALEEDYISTIDAVIAFLQNKNSTLAHSICNTDFLPQGSRFDQLQELDWAFGTMGIQDHARHLATLYIEDLGDLIKEAISPYFGFSRYAEKLGRSASSFDEMQEALEEPVSFLDLALLSILEEYIEEVEPDVVAFSVPFPGNLYGAFKCGQYLKQYYPDIKVIMGGGFPNTELRSLEDPRVFDYIDFITLDDGEGPLLQLTKYFKGEIEIDQLQRTFVRRDHAVEYINTSQGPHIPHTEVGVPNYEGLPLDSYLSIIEVVNPMHRLWSDGRWNKLTLAHGCYWKKCTFCDVTLDYISRYDAAPAEQLVDRIEGVIEQTGQTGFHFVDEAAPPLVLRDLALELIKRRVHITWWTNIRFEKTFTPDLCQLLAKSGCIAVSGGLEVASDRLLNKMKKGVSIEQVAQVNKGFTEAGIMVHAYLMYGFPTQTEQETIDSLEVVRQLFEHNIIQSGFWHRFSMTAHSPVGKNPEEYGVVRVGPEFEGFAENDLWHEDPEGCDHDMFTEGLNKAIFNYMHGLCLDWPVNEWFDFETEETTHPPFLIEEAISKPLKKDVSKIDHTVIFLGKMPEVEYFTLNRKGKKERKAHLYFADRQGGFEVKTSAKEAEWLLDHFEAFDIRSEESLKLQDLANSYLQHVHPDFNRFINGHLWQTLRKHGMLLIRL